jgi:hypothetical protein
LEGEDKAKMLARATLESLLRERKLDTTLAVFPSLTATGARRRDPDAQMPTGHARTDQCLDGGWPRGHLSMLSGPLSAGRTTLVIGTLAAATGGGELAALVDAADRFDPVPAEARGVVLARVLWVRGRVSDRSRLAHVPSGPSGHRRGDQWLTQSIRAFDLILRAGGFAVVVLDLSGVPPRALGGLPLTTWLRLGRSVEGSRTSALVVADAPVARSAGGVSLELAPAPARWRGTSARLFEGPSIAPRMRGFRKAALPTSGAGQ